MTGYVAGMYLYSGMAGYESGMYLYSGLHALCTISKVFFLLSLTIFFLFNIINS
jgi:hypothetical protein